MRSKPPRYAVAVVTGASSGLGRELSRQLAALGTAVAVLARREAELGSLVAEIETAGGRALAVPCDVADRESVTTAIDRVREALGPIDLVVANAAIGAGREVGRVDFDLVERLYRVNVFGALYTIYAALPDMLERGRGHVVGVSSLAGYQGLPGKGSYSATKAALRIELEALRGELRPRGIHVTTICPGFVRTPMTDLNDFDMPFLMDVEKGARHMLRAILRRRRLYDFPWPLAMIVRFGRAAPRAVFDWLARRAPKEGSRTQPMSDEG
jgi:short-subunit dehydrogenase